MVNEVFANGFMICFMLLFSMCVLFIMFCYQVVVIMEKLCLNCEHFTAPNRCYGFMEVTRPFGVCEEWIEADVEQIEDNRRDVDTCCVYNAQQRLQNTFIDIERLQAKIADEVDEIKRRNDRYFICITGNKGD